MHQLQVCGLKIGERGANLLSRVFSDRTCRNSSTLSQGKFRPDIRKYLFSEKMVEHCNRFLSELVYAPGLSVFKRQCP